MGRSYARTHTQALNPDVGQLFQRLASGKRSPVFMGMQTRANDRAAAVSNLATELAIWPQRGVGSAGSREVVSSRL